MSKIFYQSLRLGYIIAPHQLIEPMIKIRAVMDQHSPAIDQATLARFLTEGFFLTHIKRMRKLYSDRRDFFIEQFNKLLGKSFILEIPEAGLHFVAWVRTDGKHNAGRSRAAVCRWRRYQAVAVVIVFYESRAEARTHIFGFAAWSRAQIREGLLASSPRRLISKLNLSAGNFLGGRETFCSLLPACCRQRHSRFSTGSRHCVGNECSRNSSKASLGGIRPKFTRKTSRSRISQVAMVATASRFLKCRHKNSTKGAKHDSTTHNQKS